VEREEDRSFDDMLVEDLEPSEEEQRAIVGGAAKKSHGDEEEPPVQA
jgi:hypothetical protein